MSGPDAPRDNPEEFPGIEASDCVLRVIEKPAGHRVTLFASGAVVVRLHGQAPRTYLPGGSALRSHDGQPADAAPKESGDGPEPLNVSSGAPEEIGRALSNFACRPFVLDGHRYACIEAWYQGLKWPERKRRAEIARLSGAAAKRAGDGAPKADHFRYEETDYAFGSPEHHQLVKRAIQASLEQSPTVRAAFVATHPRPIEHDTGRPEKPGSALPGSKFVEILLAIRQEWVAEAPAGNG